MIRAHFIYIFHRLCFNVYMCFLAFGQDNSAFS